MLKVDRLCKIIIYCLFLFTFFVPVQAADFPYIDKSKIRLSIPAGSSKYGEIVIENPTMQDKTMRIYLEDWCYLPVADGSKEFVSAGTLPNSCALWTTFSPAEITIPPFGQKRVSYSIKVPPDATGTYYAVLFFESQFAAPVPEEGGVGAGVNLALRTAALFYVEVEGTIKRTGEFANLSVKKEDNSDKLLIALDFHNTGNTDITTKGLFDIMGKNKVYARGEFNEAYTFAGDTAKLNTSWSSGIPAGQYTLVLTFDLGKNLKEAGMGSGPIIVKEAELEIGEGGGVIKVGELK